MNNAGWSAAFRTSSRLAALLSTLPALLAMGGVPAPFEQSHDVFIRPRGPGVEFIVLSGRERRHPRHQAAAADPTMWASDLAVLTERLAVVPHGAWIVFQYLDEHLPSAPSAILRDELQATCRHLEQRCAFAF